MSKPTIPETVIQALAAVHEGGAVNLLDRDGVAFLCEMDCNFGAADWILNASAPDYLAALTEMGRRRTEPS